MASDAEKKSFIDSLQAVIDACHDKAEDGGLTQAQRDIFERNELNFVQSQTAANSKDFAPVDSADAADAIVKNNDASVKASAAVNPNSVQAAKKALSVAQAAVDGVLG
ncbi:MAG: hypothetical protein ABSB19_03195 [Methylomonas sp.]|jgi:hypothetical protein